jgi:hypothetical protein
MNELTGRRLLFISALAVAVTLVLSSAAAQARQLALAASAPRVICRGNPNIAHTLVLPVPGSHDRGRDVSGEYAAPRQPPKGLVVFAHGHGHSVLSWTWILEHVAASDGYLAVAMEYPGTTYPDPANPDFTYGWRVREGAAQSIRAAQLFARSCHGLRTIVDYGVSMGGNTAGLMAEANAKRPNGRPLFDLWFDIEGVTNLTEEYLEARTLAASGSSFAKTAVAEIEAEAGGPIEQVPGAYNALTVVAHADQVKSSGVRGVVIVQAVDDGLVGYNQTQEMASRLGQLGVPTEVYSVGRRAPGSDTNDTTLDGYIPVKHQLPLAGHGFEGSHTQTVISTGLNQLDAMLQDREPWPQGFQQHFVDGVLGQLF